jgi:hypothetical protein
MEAILEKILRREIPHCRALISAERLSGGASQETYRLEHERLQALLGAVGDLNELRWSLTNALRHGDTQLLCVNGNLLPNRGMPLPSTIWDRCTHLEKVFQRTIRLR